MTNKKIKLLYVVNAVLPNDRAHGIQISNTCAAMGKTGVDLTLVTPTFSGLKTSIFEHYDIESSFKHHKVWALNIPKFPFQFQLRSATFFFFINFFILYTFFVALLQGRKLIIYVRGEVIFSLLQFTFFIPMFFETHQIRNYENAYKLALQRVKGIVVITERLKEKFVEEYGIKKDKIIVARDSVDLDKFSNVSKDRSVWTSEGIDGSKKIVLYAGSLGTEKGVHTVAGSSTYLSIDTQVVFIGGNEAQVTAFKQTYKDIKSITMLGHIDHKLVPKYVAAADVLVLPDLFSDTYSNLYTSPMKLFEYMASGRVIVASNIPSLREVLTEDSTLFFESGNEKSLAAKLTEVLNDTKLSKKLGRKAQKIVSEFTWSKRGLRIMDHIIGLYN